MYVRVRVSIDRPGCRILDSFLVRDRLEVGLGRPSAQIQGRRLDAVGHPVDIKPEAAARCSHPLSFPSQISSSQTSSSSVLNQSMQQKLPSLTDRIRSDDQKYLSACIFMRICNVPFCPFSPKWHSSAARRPL